MFLAVIPAFNEEKKIKETIKDVKNHVDSIVVVDDGSVDDTAIKAKEEGVGVVSHDINRGQGAAIETGLQHARNEDADYVLIFDGDGQFSGEEIPEAFEKLKKNNADVLLGSRFIGDTKTNIPWSKKSLLFPASKLLDRFFTGLSLTDVHNGFRIFNKNAIEKIKISQDRMAHATEIPMLIKKYNLDYIEHPISVSYDDYGQNALSGLEIVKDLIFGKFIK